MPIDRTDFDSIGVADLQELLENQIPEGPRLDYKQAIYGDNDAEKHETVKDISSFANTHGGHLIIGIAEAGGIPASIDGVLCADPDAYILKIEQRISSGIQPRIQGIRIKSIVLANGNYCFIIRVPKSWRPPHRVTAQGKNRFYARNSAGVYEPDVEELRMLFAAGADFVEKVRQFRQDRINKIVHGGGQRPVHGDGRLIVHIIPFASLQSDFQVDLNQVYQQHGRFAPLGSNGMTPRFNFDGFINERGGAINHGYTQIFRNGIVEAVKAGMVRKPEQFPEGVVPAVSLEEHFFEQFHRYMDALRDLQVPPPFAVVITLEGASGAMYWVRQDPYGDDNPPPIEYDPLYLPECLINAYGDNIEYQKAVRPAFDALWNAAGRSSAQYFNGPNGVWQRPPR
jgi:hypothetical protein